MKDLKNDIRILQCKNVKLEEEKEYLANLLKDHRRYCSLKMEEESMNSYPNEEEFYPNQEQIPRMSTQHQIYRDQASIPINFSSYIYPTEN